MENESKRAGGTEGLANISCHATLIGLPNTIPASISDDIYIVI